MRALDLETLFLEDGTHDTPEEGMSLMEAVAYVAGEPHSDRPECASTVLAAFLRQWSNSLRDVDRQGLKPLIPRLIDSAAAGHVEARRAWMAADWLIRTHSTAWLDLAGLGVHATVLRHLPELVDRATLERARFDVEAAQGAAFDTANKAIWEASRAAGGAPSVGVAALGTAESRVMLSAGGAAWAAGKVIFDDAGCRHAAGTLPEFAAKAACGVAATVAAKTFVNDPTWPNSPGIAAGEMLEKTMAPTVVMLQSSAMALLDRMIEARSIDSVN